MHANLLIVGSLGNSSTLSGAANGATKCMRGGAQLRFESYFHRHCARPPHVAIVFSSAPVFPEFSKFPERAIREAERSPDCSRGLLERSADGVSCMKGDTL